MKLFTFISLICFLMFSCGGREKASWYDTPLSVVDDANHNQSTQNYNGYVLEDISENSNKSNLMINLSHHRAMVKGAQLTKMNLYFDLDQFIYKLVDLNKDVIEIGKIECIKTIDDQCRSFQLISSVNFSSLVIEKGSLQIEALESKNTQIINSYKISFPFLLPKMQRRKQI